MERITSRQNPLITACAGWGAEKDPPGRGGIPLRRGQAGGEALRWGPPELLAVVEGTAPGGAARRGCGWWRCRRPAAGGVHRGDTPGHAGLCRCRTPLRRRRCRRGRLLVLDGVQDPGNVGTVWRTADAFGAAGLFCLRQVLSPLPQDGARHHGGLFPPAGVGGDVGG